MCVLVVILHLWKYNHKGHLHVAIKLLTMFEVRGEENKGEEGEVGMKRDCLDCMLRLMGLREDSH